MSDIGFDDVLKIIDAVRNSTTGGVAPPDAPPAPGPAGDPAISASPPYGHHSTLTPEQAQAFQMMMLIQGHNGDTIGRGHVIDHPVQSTPNPDSGPAVAANNV